VRLMTHAEAARPIAAVPAQPVAASVVASTRNVMIDAWRGMALALMGLAHVGNYLRANLVAATFLGERVNVPGWSSFFAGLVTKVAAPTFWLLAGVSVALLEASRRRAGASQKAITQFLLIRSLVLVTVDLTLCTLFWPDAEGDVHVLLSLGVSLAILSVLRLLPLRWIAVITAAVFLGYQLFLLNMPAPLPAPQNYLHELFVIPNYAAWPAIEFPVLNWCGIMFAGYLLGRQVSSPWLRRSRSWLLIGVGLLLTWLIFRLLGGFGDYMPYVPGTPWYYFFVMSKAPLSLTYISFFLGCSFLLVTGLMAWGTRFERQPIGRWLIVLGQVSLFVYVAHLAVYGTVGALFRAMPLHVPVLVQLATGWVLGLAVLVPAAYTYRRFKKAHPRSVLRYF
jgi:uncharacterized membrane protein